MISRLTGALTGSDGARERWTGDSGSLPLAMLIVVSGVSLSLALTSSVLAQLTSTRIDIGRADALNAAQAGLDVVAAHIRGATDNDGDGRLGLLPCDEVNGSVGGPPVGTPPPGEAPPPRPGYRVVVQYFEFNPATTPTGNPVLDCYQGSGTTKVPGFAVLTSAGNDGKTNGISRTVKATYILRTTNQNIPGGQIHVWVLAGATIDLCFDAGPVMPTAANNIELRLQRCDVERNDPEQKFAYHSNLTLVYVASKSAANPLGMCLDAGLNPLRGAPVRFKPCTSTTTRNQQWSFTNARNFVGTSASNDFTDLCFNVETPNTPNSRVVMGHRAQGECYTSADNATQMWVADAPVGAGAAEMSPYQLVNFAQFGRCLDITQYNVLFGFLISYPCKQAPSQDKINFNQRFIVPPLSSAAGEVVSGTGTIYTDIGPAENRAESNGYTGKFCLTRSASPTTDPIVIVTRCPATGGPPPTQRWRVVRKAENYTNGYRIETEGVTPKLCLAAGEPTNPAHMAPDGMSKIVVSPCSGSTMQKWNAPAYVRDPSPLIDFSER